MPQSLSNQLIQRSTATCHPSIALGRGKRGLSLFALCSWVNATALLRIDPQSDSALRMGSNVRNLKNKVMELRKVRFAPNCIHERLAHVARGALALMCALHDQR